MQSQCKQDKERICPLLNRGSVLSSTAAPSPTTGDPHEVQDRKQGLYAPLALRSHSLLQVSLLGVSRRQAALVQLSCSELPVFPNPEPFCTWACTAQKCTSLGRTGKELTNASGRSERVDVVRTRMTQGPECSRRSTHLKSYKQPLCFCRNR